MTDLTDTAQRPAVRQTDLITLLRPHQWIKNMFVAAPLFFTPAAVTTGSVLATAGGIACFCAVSSAIYILNDYADREADRMHPSKRHRPLAAGTVSVATAFRVMAALLLAGFSVALLSPVFAAILGLYLVANLAYSFHLKHFAIVDVMIVAFGFVLRIQAGAELIDVTPSAWIIIMTGLLALFLGLAKRRDDLIRSLDGDHRRSLDGYTVPFVDAAQVLITGALLVAYLIYTTDVTVMARMGTDRLFYTAPFVVFGILRYLQITMVEERSGSPTKVVLTDRALIVTILGWIATFGILIYEPAG